MWTAAIGAGLVAGVGMGLMMHFVANAMPTIAALYGQSSVAAGWVAHLFHSVIFALLFVLVVTRSEALRRYARTTWGVVALALIYGVVLTAFAAFAMPLWLNAVADMGMPVPAFNVGSLMTHLVYGLLLGGSYAAFRGTADAARDDRTAGAAR